ncbi:MAG: ketoacyl-ACP synthase III [Chlamydiae bacterium]|nr:ketoacyl-ACP synthase III [Chlamydiota bacterium]
MLLKKAVVLGTGSYFPERVLSNAELEKIVDTTDEWITSRTGMKERRIAAKEESASDMGAIAAEKAIQNSDVKAEDLDLIICATLTPDHLFPSTACLIQNKIGAKNAAAFDLSAACSGYVYAMMTAKAYVSSGIYKTVLVVATEKISSIIDYTDRATCVLFGDAATATVVAHREHGLEIIHGCLGADGTGADMLIQPAGGSRMPACQESIDQKLHYLRMEGKDVYKHAVRRMEEVAMKCITDVGMKIEDVGYLIPHQANLRIIEGFAKRFQVPQERVIVNIQRYGNTAAASVGIGFDELLNLKKIKEGETVLMVAFGAGLAWGSLLLQRRGS